MRTYDAIDKVSEKIIKSGLCRAIVVKGSIGRGDDDEYSDVDLYALAKDDTYQLLLKERENFLEAYGPLVFREEVNFGLEQMIGIYENALHIDLYIASSLEQMGTLDPVKVIYDPESLFEAYKAAREEMKFDEIAQCFNTVLYDFVEADSAYQRNNLVWAGHIMSNAVANCAILLRWKYDKKYTFLGLKKINEILPGEEYDYLLKAYTALHKNDFKEANKTILTMLKLFYSECTDDELLLLDKKFYQWTKENYATL